MFTLRCRDKGLTPPSLRLKCPINTQRAREIVRKAEKELLRERLRVINNKLEQLDRKKAEINKDLNAQGFPDDIKQNIISHLANSREKQFQDVRARQKNKFDRLVEKSTPKPTKTKCASGDSNVDLSGSQLKSDG